MRSVQFRRMMRRAVLLAAAGLSIVAGPLARAPSGDPTRIAAGAIDGMAEGAQAADGGEHHADDRPSGRRAGRTARAPRAREGVRTALLTLTRGEAGDNAIGPELFDALGLFADGRTGERGALLRPRRAVLHCRRGLWVLETSRGSADEVGSAARSSATWCARFVPAGRSSWCRDGRGRRATVTASIKPPASLRPKRSRLPRTPAPSPSSPARGCGPGASARCIRAAGSETDEWQVAIDPGVYDPLLGDSFTNIARAGLSLQRSQTAGRLVRTFGPDSALLPARRTASDRARARPLRRSRDLARGGLSAARSTGTAACVGTLRRIARGSRRRARGVSIHGSGAPLHRRSPEDSRPRARRFSRPPTRTSRSSCASRNGSSRRRSPRRSASSSIAVAEPPGTKPPSGPVRRFCAAGDARRRHRRRIDRCRGLVRQSLRTRTSRSRTSRSSALPVTSTVPFADISPPEAHRQLA